MRFHPGIGSAFSKRAPAPRNRSAVCCRSSTRSAKWRRGWRPRSPSAERCTWPVPAANQIPARTGLALRVYVTPGGCSGFSYGMTFADGTEEDDTIVEMQGVRVVVDPMSAMYIKGSEIDFVDALMGGGFALRNPNAVSSCGCGQSFRTADQSGTAKACHH